MRFSRRASELEPEAEPYLSGRLITADPHEVGIGKASHRVTPSRVVQEVARLGAELRTISAERNRLEDTEIEIPLARAAQEVSPGIAPLVTGLRKGGWIVIRLVRSGVADATGIGDLVDCLLPLTLA